MALKPNIRAFGLQHPYNLMISGGDCGGLHVHPPPDHHSPQ